MSSPLIFIAAAFVKCDNGTKPVLVALVDEQGNVALNTYVVPNGTIVDWRTQATSLTSFQDLLECNPIHMDTLMEYFRMLVAPETVLVGHDIGAIADAMNIRPGEDCAAVIDIADWFALRLSADLTQYFSLAHQVKHIMEETIADEMSGEHDPLIDAQYIRFLYMTYCATPFHHPAMRQIRQTLYNEYPKEKRVVDPAITISVDGIPDGFNLKDLKKMIPTQVQHCVEKIMPIDWVTLEDDDEEDEEEQEVSEKKAEVEEKSIPSPREGSVKDENTLSSIGSAESEPTTQPSGEERRSSTASSEKSSSAPSTPPTKPSDSPKLGSTTIMCKSAADVRQILLRLHSNPDDWDWQVTKEGQRYVNKDNAIVLKEVDNPDEKLYVHSVPDEWTELEVKSIIPPILQPHVKEVKTTQYKKTKSGAMLGRTHIIFTEDWCVWRMLQMLNEGHCEHWEWSTQDNGNVIYAFRPEAEDGSRLNVIVEPVVPITWTQLMSYH